MCELMNDEQFEHVELMLDMLGTREAIEEILSYMNRTQRNLFFHHMREAFDMHQDALNAPDIVPVEIDNALCVE